MFQSLDFYETRFGPVEIVHYNPGEMQTVKRHATGNVSIVECDPSGKHIILENTSESVPEDVSHFKIRRVVDGTQVVTFQLPPRSVIYPKEELKIFGRNIVVESQPSGGQGAVVETFLYTSHGIEKASHIQTTVASSR